MNTKTLAITGGTGFVGQHLIKQARADGWHVRALSRQHRAAEPGIDWIQGTLDERDRLAELAKGSDVIIHVAGATNVPTREAFEAANVTGTLNMVEAARSVGVDRFIHVSSLAARYPDLSNYGWSKAKAEAIVSASGLDWTIIRPPAVYGPGDRDHLELFRFARYGFIPMAPTKKLSVIEVSDLTRALLAVVPHAAATAAVFEVDDGHEGGWTADGFAKCIGWAVDKQVSVITLPKWGLDLVARALRLVQGDKARLTPDRVSYMCHPDWTIDPAMRPPAHIWQPSISTRGGMKATAHAYRAAGWL